MIDPRISMDQSVEDLNAAYDAIPSEERKVIVAQMSPEERRNFFAYKTGETPRAPKKKTVLTKVEAFTEQHKNKVFNRFTQTKNLIESFAKMMQKINKVVSEFWH